MSSNQIQSYSMQHVQEMISDREAFGVQRPVSFVNDWSEAQVKAFLYNNGYPTDGVDAGAVDGAALIKLFFDPHARDNFCEAVPDGMGFDPDVFETRFKPQMRELLKMHTSWAKPMF